MIPALRLDFYEGLLRQLKTAFPNVRLNAFSAPEIHFIAKVSKLPIDQVIARLQAAGLESIGAHHSMDGAGMERLIVDAGFTPRQRRTRYEPLETRTGCRAMGRPGTLG